MRLNELLKVFNMQPILASIRKESPPSEKAILWEGPVLEVLLSIQGMRASLFPTVFQVLL
jgi:hypothetical protein